MFLYTYNIYIYVYNGSWLEPPCFYIGMLVNHHCTIALRTSLSTSLRTSLPDGSASPQHGLRRAQDLPFHCGLSQKSIFGCGSNPDHSVFWERILDISGPWCFDMFWKWHFDAFLEVNVICFCCFQLPQLPLHAGHRMGHRLWPAVRGDMFVESRPPLVSKMATVRN
jgi:hypothetical protein